MAHFKFARSFFAFIAFFLFACSGDNSTDLGYEEIVDEAESSDSANSSDEAVDEGIENSPVVFTEVDVINVDYKDHEGGDAGWVELYNRTNSTVDLSGFFLTDAKNDLRRWKFGKVSIPAKSFMLVFLSAKDYPDYVAPHDSIDMIGPGCWTWTDLQNTPVAGFSYANPLPEKSKICYTENGKRRVGVDMKFGDNKELGWTSISVFVGTGSSSKTDTRDLSAANELLLTGFISKDRSVSLRLTQPDVEDWQGYEIKLKGTGDPSWTYRAPLPSGGSFPDLKNIYGTRFSPGSNETKEVRLDVSSYVVRNRGHEPHANFKASKNGGSLYLVSPEEKILTSVKYPELSSGKTWTLGLGKSGKAAWGYGSATPYAMESKEVFSALSESPKNSLPPSGFYDEPIAISFEESSAVRCEQGGFAPTEKSPAVSRLSINKTTVLRCAAYASGKEPSAIENRTYIFEKQPTIASVFITGDPLSFFDPDSGIYMEGNFAQETDPHYGANYWEDRELPVFVELLEACSKTPNFAENAGYQIFGNYSRMQPKKSAAIVFREKYGKKRLQYKLFPEFPSLNEFKVFVLRNNGSNGGADYIRDRLSSSLSEGLDVDYQRGRPSIVYYNGEYFGIHNIRERATEYYFETHYGYDSENIDLLKADNSVSNGSAADYMALMDWLEGNHLDSEKKYSYVASKIDVDNLMNYMHTEIFANNRDWPSNNLKKWRCTNPATLWKWFLYDLDFGFGNSMSEYTNNIFEFITEENGKDWPNGPKSTLLFRRLMENENFRIAFVNRFAALLSMNFSGTRVTARINSMMSEINAEVSRDQKRWNRSASYMNQNLLQMKEFAVTRQSVLKKEMKEFFGLNEIKTVKLSVNGSGRILVHGLRLDNKTLEIDFFQGLPVTLTAEPAGGSVFTGWSDGVKSKTRTVLPESLESLTATFK